MDKFELSPEFKKAFELLEKTQTNVFITGKAGTGKSTFLKYFSAHSAKKPVVLAPTGVAAINVAGQTIHSFFRLRPGISIEEAKMEGMGRKNSGLYKKMRILVIDEISMVRADLLDCVDAFLKGVMGNEKPFGGKQMVFIGDLYQLPPIVQGHEMHTFGSEYKSPYFFDAKAMENLEYTLFEHSNIYRQKDLHFIELLNKIRNKTASPEDLEKINSRMHKDSDSDDGYLYLVTTNKIADEINLKKLAKLAGAQYNVRGAIEGEFNPDALPAERTLSLKKGAQVMFLTNDPQKRWVNGTLATITSVSKNEIRAKINAKEVPLTPHKWEIFRYKFDPLKNEIEKEEIGSFTQYPLRLAWAITIHKSQGKTFDKVIIDIGSGTFAHGQLYVALSRCVSLDGIKIKTKIERHHILIDDKIQNFAAKAQTISKWM